MKNDKIGKLFYITHRRPTKNGRETYTTELVRVTGVIVRERGHVKYLYMLHDKPHVYFRESMCNEDDLKNSPKYFSPLTVEQRILNGLYKTRKRLCNRLRNVFEQITKLENGK